MLGLSAAEQSWLSPAKIEIMIYRFMEINELQILTLLGNQFARLG